MSFYKLLVEHLKNHEVSAPKMRVEAIQEDVIATSVIMLLKKFGHKSPRVKVLKSKVAQKTTLLKNKSYFFWKYTSYSKFSNEYMLNILIIENEYYKL